MRAPRIIGKDICYHIRCQCNNKEFRFETDDDFCLYETVLSEYIKKYGFHLNNYTLMHTHVHLIITIINEFTIDRVMRSINQIFAHKYNLRKGRSGHLWLARYKSSVIDSDEYFLCCNRYLDRNATRAGIVSIPKDWQWGGFHFYAYGRPNNLITPSSTYLGLDDAQIGRQEKYRKFVEDAIPSDEIRDKEWIHSRWPKRKHR
ncbi:MAG: hypothetical protein A3H42_04165 [Deltaproteobacteria bacterium RIFCSPLOWO2_02_FULL_46_8]|nr:MAG: hypothetical protein A3H42_04165 [Deltaproteobacteria bacterium RIFCSPLOWO2_02_FULL_46_8]